MIILRNLATICPYIKMETDLSVKHAYSFYLCTWHAANTKINSPNHFTRSV